jgi:SulP family sulfate permease
LVNLNSRLHDADIRLHLTEVKGPVMDRLARSDFLKNLGTERVFLTTQNAYEKLAAASSLLS